MQHIQQQLVMAILPILILPSYFMKAAASASSLVPISVIVRAIAPIATKHSSLIIAWKYLE